MLPASAFTAGHGLALVWWCDNEQTLAVQRGQTRGEMTAAQQPMAVVVLHP